ncbi:hypothetical protein SO802_029359 [Lithocarpus litseifolius]|uniref:BHLH domain-containing protein n=1 Tax=Lithocarpus litseifolius TaxID=425828 RepID=A0AAW2BSW9_9ROSI
MPQSKLARRRHQKLSEKTQSLQRLMPWDTKMDMATVMDLATMMRCLCRAIGFAPKANFPTAFHISYISGSGIDK